MTTLGLIALLFAFLGIGITLLLRRMTAPASVTACDPEWINEFSISRYKPMLRLLDERDLKFLSSQPGCSSRTLRGLRAERRRIFRTYLRGLTYDFNRLHMAARMLLLYSEQDRPELAAQLVRQRVQFSCNILLIESRLAMHALGLGTVDVAGLLASVDTMRVQVCSFSPASTAA